MPLASIVIPCHNAARHLRDTLESAVSQTMRDVEIICVDNNSDDDTPDILSEFSHRDSRVRVIEEHEPGEGPARDAGRSIARGSWVYFLDSDDRMEPQLLEHACSRGEQTDADIVIFRTSYLDDQTGEVRPCPECFDISWISRWLSPGVFSPQDNPERIFTSFQNWVHNKVFRAEFIEQQSLAFQRVHRMADILFTCRALSEAKRIALLTRSFICIAPTIRRARCSPLTPTRSISIMHSSRFAHRSRITARGSSTMTPLSIGQRRLLP